MTENMVHDGKRFKYTTKISYSYVYPYTHIYLIIQYYDVEQNSTYKILRQRVTRNVVRGERSELSTRSDMV